MRCGRLLFRFRITTGLRGLMDGGVRDGVQYYFIDCPELFDRDGFYGPKTGAGDYAEQCGTLWAYSAGRCWRRPSSLACRRFSMCMTGRRRWCRSAAEVGVLLRSCAAVGGGGAVDSQCGIPGMVSTEYSGPQLLLPWDIVYLRQGRTERYVQLSQGRAGVFGLPDDGEPDVRGRRSRRRSLGKGWRRC